MMSDTTVWWMVAGGFGAGLFLGLIYFGGLWLTVRHLTQWRRPEWVFLLSFLVRTLAVAGLLLLLARGGWQVLATSTVGILAVRFVLTRYLGPARGQPAEG